MTLFTYLFIYFNQILQKIKKETKTIIQQYYFSIEMQMLSIWVIIVYNCNKDKSVISS